MTKLKYSKKDKESGIYIDGSILIYTPIVVVYSAVVIMNGMFMRL